MNEIRFHPQVKRDIKRLPAPLVTELRETHLQKIREIPEAGAPLKAALKGILSYHFGYRQTQYRIAYVYQSADNTVTVLMIRERENFYDVLKRRMS